MDKKREEIRNLLMPVFQRMHIHLVDLELRGHYNSQVLTVFADTEMGITMDEIVHLTREIEDVLDMHQPIKGHYRLEVSSPGIGRPLREVWQFRKNQGRKLRVLTSGPEGEKEYTGLLESVTDENIVLKIEKKEITIPLAEIHKAVVKLNW